MADENDKAPSCKFEVEFTIKPAKKDEPKGGNGVVVVCILIAALLVWLMLSSGFGRGPGAGTYPTAIPGIPQYVAP